MSRRSTVALSLAALAVFGVAWALSGDESDNTGVDRDVSQNAAGAPAQARHGVSPQRTTRDASMAPAGKPEASLRQLDEAAAQIAEARESEARIRRQLAEEGYEPDDYVLRRHPDGTWSVGIGFDEEPLLPDETTTRELFFNDPDALHDTAAIFGPGKQGDAVRRCKQEFLNRGGRIELDENNEARCAIILDIVAKNGVGRVTGYEARPAWCAEVYDKETEQCIVAAYQGAEFRASHDYQYRLRGGFITISTRETEHDE